MKKLFIVLCFLLLFAVSSFAAEEIYCPSILSETIAASGTAYGDTLETERKSGFEGFFSVQVNKTGTGVLQVLYQVSNDGTTWSPTVEIVAAATSGTVYPYPAVGVNIFSGYQRLVFTETGTANNVVVTGAYRCAQ